MERRDEGSDIIARVPELPPSVPSWKVVLWRGLRGGPLRWRRSHPFHGFFLDLYCDAARLAVEVEGARRDPVYDAQQDETVAEAGVLTLRFTNVEIGADPLGCLERIRAVAAARASAFENSAGGE